MRQDGHRQWSLLDCAGIYRYIELDCKIEELIPYDTCTGSLWSIAHTNQQRMPGLLRFCVVEVAR